MRLQQFTPLIILSENVDRHSNATSTHGWIKLPPFLPPSPQVVPGNCISREWWCSENQVQMGEGLTRPFVRSLPTPRLMGLWMPELHAEGFPSSSLLSFPHNPGLAGVPDGPVSSQNQFKESVVWQKNITESNFHLHLPSWEASKGRVCVFWGGRVNSPPISKYLQHSFSSICCFQYLHR